VFKSTENITHHGHVTDTQCRPNITAAYDEDWGKDKTTLWPCILLAGEDASKGESKDERKKHAISYLHYLLLARPDLYVAQGFLISDTNILFLLGIGGRGIHGFSVAWNDAQFYKLMAAFMYRLYDPGDFRDQSYVKMDRLQNNQVAYTIQISVKTKVDGVETEKKSECAGFSPLYASRPFGGRTHILSNPNSEIEIDGKPLRVLKDQLCRPNPRFEEYNVLTRIHESKEVPGVVEAVYHDLIVMPGRFNVEKKKHRMGLRQSGSPIMSVPTLKEMLEIVFDAVEGNLCNLIYNVLRLTDLQCCGTYVFIAKCFIEILAREMFFI
jgi:hypothetical protein